MIKHLFLAAFLATTPVVPAQAQSVQDQIVSQLSEQGFTRFEAGRALTGEILLLAFSSDLEREVLFNPQTGEIIRDRWQAIGTVPSFDPKIAAEQRRARRDDDDDDDDDD